MRDDVGELGIETSQEMIPHLIKVTGLCYFRLAALMSLGFSAGAVGLAAYYYFYQTQQQVGERLLEVQLPMVPPVRLLVGRSVCHNFLKGQEVALPCSLVLLC